MAKRLKRVRVVALRIDANPHPPGIYVDLLTRARRTKTLGVLYSDKYAMVSMMTAKPDDHGYHFGKLATFTEVDLTKPVFNMDTGEAAEPAEVETIKMPEGLKPLYEPITFHFHPPTHQLFMERSISPVALAKALTQILNNPRVKPKDIELVHVTAEQSQEGLDRILREDRVLTKIEIVVTQPNPDDTSDDEEDDIVARLAAQGAHRLDYTLTGDKASGGLTPDNRTRGLAKAALTHGVVKAKGFGADDVSFEDSTEHHLRVEQVTFDPAAGEDRDTGLFRAISRWLKPKAKAKVPEE